YENHALIIVNYGSDDGNDIADFMHEIQKVVKTKYNIELEPEVWVF
ncbi:MAG: UDP-N-acetylmuramate dehydrogenase, partial [Proteiniphilum sp.]|nr:UDP-N-acetylmuramate dehydrogenase [Proteiniphilum sp.]